MGKGLLVLAILLLFLLPAMSASSVDSEMQKVTHFAEEYETGNINYVQLLTHLSSVREGLNEILGVSSREMGGTLYEDQIKEVLGEPERVTKWVWVEGEHRDIKLDDPVPEWRKIVFDGKKIQIRIEAHPFVFKKGEDFEVFYSFHFQVEFKKPEEQLNINEKIDDIKSLAQTFTSDPSNENAENLARESVNAERMFENYFKGRSGNCEDVMKNIFGSENIRESQKMLLQEIDFYGNDRVDVIARLEMCDDCEWKWINLDLWADSRGRGFERGDMDDQRGSPGAFRNYDDSAFKSEIAIVLEQIKVAVDNNDGREFSKLKGRLWMLNDEWNKQSNDLWKQVGDDFRDRKNELHERGEAGEDTHRAWRDFEKLMRESEKELRESNYQLRKEFYLTLFAGYDKRESYYEQKEFEKRLVEEFREFGREVCNNLEDDNEDGLSDCADDQCAGKICGSVEEAMVVGNETIMGTKNLYCISKICQFKEDEEEEKAVCGNNICEESEIAVCPSDCTECPIYEAIECSGEVLFEGEDENGCPLPPICIEDSSYCREDIDCDQPLCGIAQCIEGTCQTTELTECKEKECEEGEKRIAECGFGKEVVVKICSEGLWKKTGASCEEGGDVLDCVPCGNSCMPREQTFVASCLETTEEFDCIEKNNGCVVSQLEGDDEEGAGSECVTIGDCGGENDVCSNGWCVALPEVIKVEEPKYVPEEEIPVNEETEEPPQEEPVEEPGEETSEQPGEESAQDLPEGEIIQLFRSLLSTKSFVLVSAEEGENCWEECYDEEVCGDVCTTDDTGAEICEPSCTTEQRCEEKCEPGSDSDPYPEPYNDGGDQGGQCWEECKSVCEGENCWEECYDEEVCGDVCTTDDTGAEICEPSCTTEQRCEEKCEVGGECHEECYEVCEGEERHDDGEDMWDEGQKEEECRDMCERTCEEDVADGYEENMDECREGCVSRCMGWETEQEPEMVEKGVFAAGGVCRTSQQETESFIWLNGWGEPFDQLQPLKHKYYEGGHADWCEWELENLQKERKEFEKGFNQDFAVWFFEDYLVNNAENWEGHASGIYELYWRNVDNQWRTAHNMKCLEIDELPYDYELINFSYDTEYGSVEYWEELKTVRLPDMQEEVTLISPYMKIWIFPNKEFLKYEMKEAMRKHEFPGPSEEKAERERKEGLTEEEKEMLSQDEGLMKDIAKLVAEYDGNVDVVVRFVDFETNELVFNLYVQINEDDIFKMEPMLAEEVPAEDVRIEVDFEKIYDLIRTGEEDMRGVEVASPPWDEKERFIPRIKDITNGIKMYFKIQGIMNSATITPNSAKGDAKKLFKMFFRMQMDDGGPGPGMGYEEEDEEKEGGQGEVWEDKEVITGEAIRA